MRSIVFSVPLTEQGVELVTEQGEGLRDRLSGAYGRTRELMGYQSIRAWIQMSSRGPLLNLYFEAEQDVLGVLQTASRSPYPVDTELKSLLRIATGMSWEEMLTQRVRPVLDWRAKSGTRGISDIKSN